MCCFERSRAHIHPRRKSHAIANSAQYQLLAGMGVESGQGFLFSRAQPFDDAVELL